MENNNDQPATIPLTRGRDLAVGDVLICGGDVPHTITSFDDHPGLTRGDTFYPARVMRSADFGITVFDDCAFRPTSDGGLIQTHLWFSYEQAQQKASEAAAAVRRW